MFNEKAEPSKASQTVAELFDKAVREHSQRLLTVAQAIVGNRVLAEDVLQQALMNLYQHRDRYDWREPGGLLRRTVVNEALRMLRRPRMSVVAEDHPGQSPGPLADLVVNETVTQVRRAIEKLPDNYRAALVLCEYENMSYVEIARTLDATVPQVKTWLHRGRRQLAVWLKDVVETAKHVGGSADNSR